MQYSTSNKHIKSGHMTQNGWRDGSKPSNPGQSVLSPALVIVTLLGLLALGWMVVNSL